MLLIVKQLANTQPIPSLLSLFWMCDVRSDGTNTFVRSDGTNTFVGRPISLPVAFGYSLVNTTTTAAITAVAAVSTPIWLTEQAS
jgi:hypothetical protein